MMTLGWKYLTRAAPSCDIFNLGFIIFQWFNVHSLHASSCVMLYIVQVYIWRGMSVMLCCCPDVLCFTFSRCVCDELCLSCYTVVQVCVAVWATAHGCPQLRVVERCSGQISSFAAGVVLAVHRPVRGTHTCWARAANWPIMEFLQIFYAPGTLDHRFMCTRLFSITFSSVV